MNFDGAYISALVVILVGVLNLFKIKVDTQQMTVFITALITVITGLIIAYKKYKEGKITVLGSYKKV